MTHRRPPRIDASLYIGPHRIFFTMCTFARRPVFTDPVVVDIASREFLRTSAEYDVEATAYCFMPDHLHALIIGCSATADLGRCMSTFRQRSGYRYRQYWRGRLWQEGYFDRHLRSDEATIDVVRYIVANPVRAGLCKAPVDFPYSGSSQFDLRTLAYSLG